MTEIRRGLIHPETTTIFVDDDGLPFRAGHFDRLPVEGNLAPDEESDTYVGLERITSSHGRSHTVMTEPGEDASLLTVVMGDNEYSQPSNGFYLHHNRKGARLPHTLDFGTSWSRYLTSPQGLNYEKYLYRPIQASSILRSYDIPAERITAAYRLRTFGALGPRKIVGATALLRSFTASGNWPKQDLEVLSVADRQFVVMDRLVKSAWRIEDITQDTIPEERADQAIDQAIFAHKLWRRRAERGVEHSTILGEAPKLDGVMTYQARKRKYIHQILPFMAGYNLARMHQLGLAHRYVSLGNISLFGEIMDLDSVVGERMGDEVTSEQLLRSDRTYGVLIGEELDKLPSAYAKSSKDWWRIGHAIGLETEPVLYLDHSMNS